MDTALKMQLNASSGNFLRPTFPELRNFSRINCAVLGQNKLKILNIFVSQDNDFQLPKNTKKKKTSSAMATTYI